MLFGGSERERRFLRASPLAREGLDHVCVLASAAHRTQAALSGGGIEAGRKPGGARRIENARAQGLDARGGLDLRSGHEVTGSRKLPLRLRERSGNAAAQRVEVAAEKRRERKATGAKTFGEGIAGIVGPGQPALPDLKPR